MNGLNSVELRTLNGVHQFNNQRYISKDRKNNYNFLKEYCSVLGQLQGFQSKGLLEFISRYVCKLSYKDVSELLENILQQKIYTSSQLQHKIIALAPVVESSEKEFYSALQLCFNFVDTNLEVLDSEQEEVLYFDDAIGVKKQKEHRKDVSYKKSSVYVQTDNIVIQSSKNSFEYLTSNHKIANSESLEDKIHCFLSYHYPKEIIRLVAITDGARSIRLRLQNLFGNAVCVILDWYHLEKKIWAYFSRLGFTKAVKEHHVTQILHYLWHGWVTETLIYTEQEVFVFSTKEAILEELQDYLLKHQAEIIDYDTRYRIHKKCIGSGRGEKANDQLVAKRQKHNGCSWSEQGSAALAKLQALQLNKRWESFWAVA